MRKFRPKSYRWSPHIIRTVAICSRETGLSETQIIEACIERQIVSALGDITRLKAAVASAAAVESLAASLLSGKDPLVIVPDLRTAGMAKGQREAKVKTHRDAGKFFRPKLSNAASGVEPLP